MQNVDKIVTVVNVGIPSSTYTFCVETEGKLPLNVIKDTFGLTRVELANEPGILSFDIYGISNVPFKFGDTVYIRGVPEERSLTNNDIDQMLKHKLNQILGWQYKGIIQPKKMI